MVWWLCEYERISKLNVYFDKTIYSCTNLMIWGLEIVQNLKYIITFRNFNLKNYSLHYSVKTVKHSKDSLFNMVINSLVKQLRGRNECTWLHQNLKCPTGICPGLNYRQCTGRQTVIGAASRHCGLLTRIESLSTYSWSHSLWATPMDKQNQINIVSIWSQNINNYINATRGDAKILVLTITVWDQQKINK